MSIAFTFPAFKSFFFLRTSRPRFICFLLYILRPELFGGEWTTRLVVFRIVVTWSLFKLFEHLVELYCEHRIEIESARDSSYSLSRSSCYFSTEDCKTISLFFFSSLPSKDISNVSKELNNLSTSMDVMSYASSIAVTFIPNLLGKNLSTF